LGIKLGLDKVMLHKLEDTYKGFLYSQKHENNKRTVRDYPGNLKDIDDYKESPVNSSKPLSADRTKLSKPESKKTALPSPAKKTNAVPSKSKFQKLLDKRRKLSKQLEDEDIEI
jgi:hypothetical protein